MSNEHPELSGYEPSGNERPLRSKHVTTMMRVIVVLGLVGLVVPGVLTTMQVASTTASNGCLAAVAQFYPLSVDYDARFELAGAGGFGWQCYAIDQNERQTFVKALGIIPSAPRQVSPGQVGPGQSSPT